MGFGNGTGTLKVGVHHGHQLGALGGKFLIHTGVVASKRANANNRYG